MGLGVLAQLPFLSPQRLAGSEGVRTGCSLSRWEQLLGRPSPLTLLPDPTLLLPPLLSVELLSSRCGPWTSSLGITRELVSPSLPPKSGPVLQWGSQGIHVLLTLRSPARVRSSAKPGSEGGKSQLRWVAPISRPNLLVHTFSLETTGPPFLPQRKEHYTQFI